MGSYRATWRNRHASGLRALCTGPALLTLVAGAAVISPLHAAAQAGDTIAVTPTTAANPAGTSHTVTATVTQPGNGGGSVPAPQTPVVFSVIDGPNTGQTGSCTPAGCATDAGGHVSFTYTSNGLPGTDTIRTCLLSAIPLVAGPPPAGCVDVTKTWLVTTLTTTPSLTTGPAPLAVTYTYRESNVGVAPIVNVVVTDNLCTPLTLVSGDTNGDGVLDPGETWVYTCSRTLTTAGTVTSTAAATGVLRIAEAQITAPVETASATVTVTARKKGDSDGDPGDHTSSDTDDDTEKHTACDPEDRDQDQDKDQDDGDARDSDHCPAASKPGSGTSGAGSPPPVTERGLVAPVSAVRPVVAGAQMTVPEFGAGVPVAPALILTTGGIVLVLEARRRRSSL